MVALRLAMWLGIVVALFGANADPTWSQFALPRAPTPVPRVMPTPLPPLQLHQPSLPKLQTPAMPQPAPSVQQFRPGVAVPPAAPSRPRSVVRARLVKALSVAPQRKMECDITAKLRARCPSGQSCKLSCSPSLCPGFGGQEFCEFFLNCAVEFVARAVLDDPVCKARAQVRVVPAPGGGHYHLVTVPVGYDCEPPQCVQ